MTWKGAFFLKIIAFSDSHRRSDRVDKLFEKTHLYTDLYIFTGDGLNDLENMFYIYPEKNILCVSGNCDVPATEAYVREVMCSGKKVVFTHGHMQHAKFGMGGLVNLAKQTGADVVIFGHTHEKKCTYEDGVYYINPGSLGIPNDGTPSYAVIDISEAGVLCSHVTL